jgi:hypothetical protein
MTTLQEQRLVASHQLGMRDATEGVAAQPPVYMSNAGERYAYVAGYRAAQRRAEGGAL